MKAYLLMGKKSAEVLLGYRVTFLDNEANASLSNAVWGYTIGLMEHDGWIIEHPTCKIPWFFNAKGVDNLFENLGEL